MRLGWPYYDRNSSSGMDYNLGPCDLGYEKNQLQMLDLNPIASTDQVYLSFEAYCSSALFNINT